MTQSRFERSEMNDVLFDFIVGFAVLATPLAIGTMIVELIESRKRRRAK
jgi:hypothetical protein